MFFFLGRHFRLGLGIEPDPQGFSLLTRQLGDSFLDFSQRAHAKIRLNAITILAKFIPRASQNADGSRRLALGIGAGMRGASVSEVGMVFNVLAGQGAVARAGAVSFLGRLPGSGGVRFFHFA